MRAPLNGGERGIRTLDTGLPYTHFPGVLLQPLGHLSRFFLEAKQPAPFNNPKPACPTFPDYSGKRARLNQLLKNRKRNCFVSAGVPCVVVKMQKSLFRIKNVSFFYTLLSTNANLLSEIFTVMKI